jgi:hypothetical protein
MHMSWQLGEDAAYWQVYQLARLLQSVMSAFEQFEMLLLCTNLSFPVTVGICAVTELLGKFSYW